MNDECSTMWSNTLASDGRYDVRRRWCGHYHCRRINRINICRLRGGGSNCSKELTLLDYELGMQ